MPDHNPKPIKPESLIKINEETVKLLSDEIHEAIKKIGNFRSFSIAELAHALYLTMFEFGVAMGLTTEFNEPNEKRPM